MEINTDDVKHWVWLFSECGFNLILISLIVIDNNVCEAIQNSY